MSPWSCTVFGAVNCCMEQSFQFDLPLWEPTHDSDLVLLYLHLALVLIDPDQVTHLKGDSSSVQLLFTPMTLKVSS